MGRWEISILLIGSIAIAVASLFREVSWFFWFGMVGGAIVWEVTKLRLRRNARAFAEARR